MYLVTRWFGIFIYNQDGIVKKKLIFKKDEIKQKIIDISNDKILNEEKKLSKNKNLIVNEKRLNKIGEYEPENSFFKKIDIKPEEYGYSNKLLQEITREISIERINKKLSSKDQQIIQMIDALDDLIQTSNLLTERYECWTEISYSDERILPFKKTIKQVKSEIARLEDQIEKDMINTAPNLSKIIGPLIGARLISIAGGLEKLGKMPASTIQILGAEKALFRFKKEGGKPPKHGIIFQHTYINKAPRKNRGKIARLLSSKISLAVKADAYTKRDISDSLVSNLKKNIKDIS